MHPAAREYIERAAEQLEEVSSILEMGGRDINGGLRDIWPAAEWTSVDLYEGPGVDVVANFKDYLHPTKVDLVISAEVFEHTHEWPKLIEAAAKNLKEDGTLLITTATNQRRPHSGIDGGELREGEWYQNIQSDLLGSVLHHHFKHVSISIAGNDVRATAFDPTGERYTMADPNKVTKEQYEEQRAADKARRELKEAASHFKDKANEAVAPPAEVKWSNGK